MGYFDQPALTIRVGGAADLIQLTDDGDTGSADSTVVAAVIADVGGLADSYFRAGGMTIPVTDTAALAAMQAPLLDIANYRLRTRDNRPATAGDLALYNAAIAWLENVAEKKISLVSSSADVTAGAYALDSDRRRFSQRSLRGW